MPALTTNAQLLRYAEDEYFSEFMLRAMKPKPGAKTPKTVTFEWGQVTSGSKMQMYSATATGVTRWSLDGEWEKHHVVELDLPKTKKGISLLQKVPGTLRLECAKLTFETGPIKRYTLPPEIDPKTLLVWGDKVITWNQLNAWLAVPPGLGHFDQAGLRNTPLDATTFDQPIVGPYYMPTRIQAERSDAIPWMFVMWMLGAGTKGHYFKLHRGTCDDAAWARAVRISEHLGPGKVLSRTVMCSSKAWLTKWAEKAAR